jgi:aminoglycoside 6-adenylyltransferase
MGLYDGRFVRVIVWEREERMASDRHKQLIERLLAWANDDENLRAVIVTGSWSRGGGSSDQFSDRDIEIIARDPKPLLDDDSWIHDLAPVWVSLYLTNDDDPETRLVFFEDALKVDFTISDSQRLHQMVSYGVLNDLYERGYQVLLDKDGIASELPRAIGKHPRLALPTEAEFGAVVSEFWFEAAHMPTYLSRDELWVVKQRDGTMKNMLLRMIEWHALVMQGAEADVWYIGTKMKRWVDPDIWQELDAIYGHFDRQDSFRSIVATMTLFSRLTHEVADPLRLNWPEHSEHHIMEYVLGMGPAILGNSSQ